jgi:hypothetical protein
MKKSSKMKKKNDEDKSIINVLLHLYNTITELHKDICIRDVWLIWSAFHHFVIDRQIVDFTNEKWKIYLKA